MGSKFPRPTDINFPNVENKLEYEFKEISKIDGTKGKITKAGLSLCGLKSGNILISYLYKDFKKLELKSCLAIYTIPDLKLVEKYIFDSEIEDIIYVLDGAFQLKNGNIFAICDKLYIFNGESIADGPKTTSEEINDGDCKIANIEFLDPDDIFQRRVVKKSSRTFLCNFLFEPKEGIILFTKNWNDYEIYRLDVSNLETKGTSIYQYSNKYFSLDIICQSKYYPENLYIIGNHDYNMENKKNQAVLLVFNLEDFCDKEKKPKNPLYTINVSNSQNVYGMCEYDEKYILLDTMNNGVYIIDIESKQKVAVSSLKTYYKNLSKTENFVINMDNKEKIDLKVGDRFAPIYRNMIKLKDGQVLLVKSHINNGPFMKIESSFFIADIKEQIKTYVTGSSGKFIVSGNYIISFFPDSKLYVHQLYND